MSKEIFGTLTTADIEMPYETAAEQAEADKFNAELAGTGFRTGRFVRDFAFATAAGEKTTLKSGDLVRVFKTITDGDVHWQGKIQFDTTHYHHGLQANAVDTLRQQTSLLGSFRTVAKLGLPLSVWPVAASLRNDFSETFSPAARKWAGMFYEALPAKLERDGKVIYGALEAFAETGTEGPIWSVQEYGRAGYDGLNCLKNGDRLTVYKTVRDGAVAWEGPVDFSAPQVTKIGWDEVARNTNHMKTRDWLQLSYQRSPAIVTPGP